MKNPSDIDRRSRDISAQSAGFKNRAEKVKEWTHDVFQKNSTKIVLHGLENLYHKIM